jgi:fatty acid desaturase
MALGIHPEPSHPATTKGRGHRLQFLVLYLVLVFPVLLALRWPSDHPAVLIGIMAVLAYVLFCWTSYFHEAAHQTLLGRSKGWSIAWGRIVGTVVGVPYTAYRETHIRHHAYLNAPADWELWPYSDPKRSRTFRRVFVWIDLIFGQVTHALIYGRIYFHRNSPLSPAAGRAIRNEYLVILAFWGAVLGTITWFGVWKEFLIAWIIPLWLGGILQSGRKLTEHLGMAAYDPLLGTRTVIGSNWLTRLCSFVNFKIFVHGLHHRHPQMSHLGLEEKMQEYLTKNPDTPYPVYDSYWSATRAMLPHMFKNPGCGVNAGADPPPRWKLPDVQDFVADVTAEVLATAE